jgi:hypothetical protein
MYYKLLLIYFGLIFTSFAGSCCGGGGGTTKIMLGDTDKVFRVSYSDRTILADKGEGEQIYLRSENELESIRSINLSASIRMSDYWQYGVLLKAMSKTKEVSGSKENYSGLGDSELNIAYEFMPEVSRNALLSQGFLYSKLRLPTGPSLYTTKRVDTLDTFGTGHFLLSVGTVFTKRFSKAMTTLTVGGGYRPSRSFDNTVFSSEEIKTSDAFSYDLAIEQSVDLSKSISLNLGLLRTYTSNLATGALSGVSKSAALNSLSVGGAYNSELYTVLASYIDEFLVGSSYNNVLGRSIELTIIRKVNL